MAMNHVRSARAAREEAEGIREREREVRDER
jgi:hypothetical protein